MIRILYKSTCSTCRNAIHLIKEKTKENIEMVEYLKEVPSEDDIRSILKMLGIKAEELVRKKEQLYKDKYKSCKISEEQWIKILHRHPELIERPIVIKGSRAIIGRPVERIVDFI
ncbi:MAG: arsenate reductase (glutaredoxin) [Bacteroidia bacterium]|nr:arsenate reductase (glutaredoxin) [Bacteroidia bacterium]MCZ2276514.1 arsenate reductase (glutaredoxin) [Bacteroidia bacterium]